MACDSIIFATHGWSSVEMIRDTEEMHEKKWNWNRSLIAPSSNHPQHERDELG